MSLFLAAKRRSTTTEFTRRGRRSEERAKPARSGAMIGSAGVSRVIDTDFRTVHPLLANIARIVRVVTQEQTTEWVRLPTPP